MHMDTRLGTMLNLKTIDNYKVPQACPSCSRYNTIYYLPVETDIQSTSTIGESLLSHKAAGSSEKTGPCGSLNARNASKRSRFARCPLATVSCNTRKPPDPKTPRSKYQNTFGSTKGQGLIFTSRGRFQDCRALKFVVVYRTRTQWDETSPGFWLPNI
jgi:hypothetical protein